MFFVLQIFGCTENDSSLATEQLISETYRLSQAGSSRATAYVDSNKIIETENYVFLTWLDYIGDKFTVSISRLDKRTNELSEVNNLDNEVFDNHGGPALVIDNEGYLHIFYGPHHGPIIYRKSLKPYQIDNWSEKEYIGSELTYPSVTVDVANTIYLIARHRELSGAWSLQFFKKEHNGEWSAPVDILVSNFQKWISEGKTLRRKLGYVRWGKSIQIGPDGKSIHLLFQNAEFLPTDLVTNYQRDNGLASYFIGYMKSEDGGSSWSANNKTIALPANPQTVEIIAGSTEPPERGAFYASSNLAFDIFGNPSAIIIRHYAYGTKVSIAKKEGQSWNLKPITATGSNYLISPVSLFIDNFNNHYCLTTTIDPNEYCVCGGNFGNSSCMLELYISSDGEDFQPHNFLDNVPIKKRPLWLPNVNYAQNAKGLPSFVFTSGPSWTTSPSDATSNDVFFTKFEHR